MTKLEEIPGKGKTTCDRDILLSIINLATKEISGVAQLSPLYKTIIGKGTSKTIAQGVKVKIGKDDGKLDVDVYIEIKNGNKVPDVSFKIQENIKNAITSMMEMKIKSVNVHVLKVCMKDAD